MAKPDYFRTFGHFIDHFAHLESYMAWFLRETAGIDKETARAIFSGVKIDAASSQVRRIYEARRKELPPLLQSALQQISILNSLRNDLVHHPLTFSDPRGLLSSTKLVAHIPERIRETVVSVELLEAAMEDMWQIGITLQAVLSMDSASPEELQWIEDIAGEEIRHAWRYKPQQQAPIRQKSRDKLPKQPRPPKPSRA